MSQVQVIQPVAEALHSRQMQPQTNASGLRTNSTGVSLDGLPPSALCLIVYHTTDIKQKLRLALTCQTLYKVVTQKKEAWPAKVCITHGHVSFPGGLGETAKPANVIRVSVGEAEADRALLPVTNDLLRLVSVMHLPAVCPVPVGLHISTPCNNRRSRQQRFLSEYVLAWLWFKPDPAVHQFASVRLDIDFGSVQSYEHLLYVWRDTAVPVHLRMVLDEDNLDRWTDIGPSMAITDLWYEGVEHNNVSNVRRLTLETVQLSVDFDLSRVCQLFRHATDVDVSDVFSTMDETGAWQQHWAHIWRAFVASRAQRSRPHTLRLKPTTHYIEHMAEAIEQLQPTGRSVGGIDKRVRHVLDEHIGPQLLVAVEEAAQLERVSLPAVKRSASHGFFKRSLVLHLRMKHQPQPAWIIEIYENHFDYEQTQS